MPIRYRCPSCRQLLGISSKMAGHTFDCPMCGHSTVVPAADVEHVLAGVGVPTGAREAPGANAAGSPAIGAEAAIEPLADAGGFRFRGRKAEADEMDLTPMVDMTFLLLIFFMITASFSVQKSLAFPRPNDERQGAMQSTHMLEELEERSVVVHIDDRNVIYVDDEPLADRSRLTAVLRQALSSQRNELLLTADDNAWHESVVAVIDAASAAGMQKIRLAASAPE
jgi:biopolymer transport protein ExbD